MDIDEDELTVRCVPLPWFGPYTVQRSVLQRLTVGWAFNIPRLQFDYKEPGHKRVAVMMPYKSRQILDDLRGRGYPVVDQRKGQRRLALLPSMRLVVWPVRRLRVAWRPRTPDAHDSTGPDQPR